MNFKYKVELIWNFESDQNKKDDILKENLILIKIMIKRRNWVWFLLEIKEIEEILDKMHFLIKEIKEQNRNQDNRNNFETSKR